MEEKIRMIEKNKTCKLVHKLEDKEVIGVKWVFKLKHNLDGTINKHKAKLMVMGYAQQYGIDYHETFSPIIRLNIIRTLIVLAAQKGWYCMNLMLNQPS